MSRLEEIKHNRSISVKLLFIILICILFCVSITIADLPGKGNVKANDHYKGSFNSVSAGSVIPGLSMGKILKHMHEGKTSPSVLTGNSKGLESDLSAASSGHPNKSNGTNVFGNPIEGNIFIKPHRVTGYPDNSGQANPLLSSGDSFSQSLEIPNPIGAKGPNPVHGGLPTQENGNPGGGNGNGHWGQGNQGNGFGNNWTGNQGRGIGAGMAAGTNNPAPDPDPGHEPDPNPDPDPDEIPDIDPEPGSDESIFSQAAPLPDELYPQIQGCPVLIEAAAQELGTNLEMIQISMGDSIANNPNIQPCQACQTIVHNATTLQGMDYEALVNALIIFFNELAPPDEPLSEEALAKIGSRLTEKPSYFEKNPEYALAMEYIDAFVGYINVLENEMGAPVGNTTEFALEKYGSPISEAGAENPNVAAYIAMQIEGLSD